MLGFSGTCGEAEELKNWLSPSAAERIAGNKQLVEAQL
jgi:hypothetical protein